MVERCIEIASKRFTDIYRYNISEGLWLAGKKQTKKTPVDPLEMLDRILATEHKVKYFERSLFILEHFDLVLENQDPYLLTKLKLITEWRCHHSAVVIMGRPYLELPEIISDIPKLNVAHIDENDLKEMLSACDPHIPEDEIRDLTDALKGLSILECQNLISLSLAKLKRLDKDFITNQRTSVLCERANGLIELCEADIDLNSVGGLETLKTWLLKRGRFFKGRSPQTESRVPCPKGVILTGPPGCGKSALASALAGSWQVKLVKLNHACLFSSLVGQTERNLTIALETVKALSPCILWIDEFEKFFPQIGDSTLDGGVLSRSLGLLLEFLQSARDGVFVWATTNRLQSLPQEIMRAGRFDAIFFVDLPNRGERTSIFEILLGKYVPEVDLKGRESLLDATEGFSGAEIEQAFIDSLYECAESEAELDEFTLLRTLKAFIPLSRTLKEDIDSLRKWCVSRARFASCSEPFKDRERREPCPMSQR